MTFRDLTVSIDEMGTLTYMLAGVIINVCLVLGMVAQGRPKMPEGGKLEEESLLVYVSIFSKGELRMWQLVREI